MPIARPLGVSVEKKKVVHTSTDESKMKAFVFTKNCRRKEI